MEPAVVFEAEPSIEVVFSLEKADPGKHWLLQTRAPQGDRHGGQWAKGGTPPPKPASPSGHRKAEKPKAPGLFDRELSPGLPVGKPLPLPPPDTRQLYQDPQTGKWQDERFQYQQSLIAGAFQEAEDRVLQPIYDAHDYSRPAAVFLVGGSGSGKSTYKRQFLLPHHRLVDIDCDAFKEQLPEYEPENPGFVHHESVDVAKRCLQRCLNEGRSFVFDSTGINVSLIERAAQKAHQAGYHVAVHYVTAHPDAALARAAKRKRKVPEHIVRLKHREVGWAFHRLQKIADSVVAHDSMSPEEKKQYGEYHPASPPDARSGVPGE